MASDKLRRCDERLRPGEHVLTEDVEDDALLRILSGQFDEAAPYPADRDGVVEEDRGRIALIDATGLNAVVQEDGDLRLDRHVECGQHGTQISRRSVEPELGGAALKLPIQLGDGIRDRARGVLDGWMTEPVIKGVTELSGDQCDTERSERSAARSITPTLAAILPSPSDRAT